MSGGKKFGRKKKSIEKYIFQKYNLLRAKRNKISQFNVKRKICTSQKVINNRPVYNQAHTS